MAETQTAYAKSAWTDPTNLILTLGGILSILADPSIIPLIPLAWMPKITAFTVIGGVIVRTWKANHPVANIAPGEVKPIEVKKLAATKPGTEEPENLPKPVAAQLLDSQSLPGRKRKDGGK